MRYQIDVTAAETSVDDWDGIRERRVFRFGTRNNAVSCWIDHGNLRGFEYQMARLFASKNDLMLQVVVADDLQQMVQMLREGKVDAIGAMLTDTPNRVFADLAPTRFYHRTDEVVVGRGGEAVITDHAQLAGRTIHVRPQSSYAYHLAALQERGASLNVAFVDADMETETILNTVAEGGFDLTVADRVIAELELQGRADLAILGTVVPDTAQVWYVRANNPVLRKHLDGFWDTTYRGIEYNMARKANFTARQEQRATGLGRAGSHQSVR
ncbi:MAG: transporter substrate-binding domain-containing protein [Planctomycetota bacterium]|jgi:membrane-bound lytic murein transglycosylase F|nr:transporter substrate-binding domain-containing protein [Planctomycetota bacterium]